MIWLRGLWWAGTLTVMAFPIASLAGSGSPANRTVSVRRSRPRDFVVRVGDERFVIRLVTPAQIATARAILAGRKPQRIVNGKLAAGSAGYNRDPVSGRRWSWHLVPETIEFAQLTTEVCDGRPFEDVEQHRDKWLKEIGRYCPWSGKLEREIKRPVQQRRRMGRPRASAGAPDE